MESLSAEGDITARYYLGGRLEVDTATDRELFYAGGDAYSAPAVYVRQGDTWEMYYIIRDYLGSAYAVTNSGGIVAEYSYDPWGRLRNPNTHELYATGEEPELLFGRGFTGHEHLAMTSGLVSGFVTNGINSGGMAALSGEGFGDIMLSTIKGAVIGGFSSMVGAGVFQGVNNFLHKNFHFNIGKTTITVETPLRHLPTNTLSYMAGSTATQVTSNLLNGRNAFENVDYGLNLGIISPLIMDAAQYSRKFGMSVIQRQFPGKEVGYLSGRHTALEANGDLILKQDVQFIEYYPYEYSIMLEDMWPFCGFPRFTETHLSQSLLMSHYREFIFNLFSRLSIK